MKEYCIYKSKTGLDLFKIASGFKTKKAAKLWIKDNKRFYPYHYLIIK